MSEAQAREGRVAVIGAGMAGLTCAAELASAGRHVVVFEKSRGLGGRMATRRRDDLRFDHGAPLADARGTRFAGFLEAAVNAGCAAPWAPGGEGAHVGVPGMNALVRPLSDGLDIRLSTEVRAVRREDDGWIVESDEGGEGFAQVVSAVPAPQAIRMLGPDGELAEEIGHVEVAPVWALMLATGQAQDWPDFARRPADELMLVQCNSSRPERPETPQSWVIHATADWTRAHLELERDVALTRLLDLVGARIGLRGEVIHAEAHRWRFALTERPMGRAMLSSADGRLHLGGDWMLGARIEDAFDSGRALAAAVLRGAS